MRQISQKTKYALRALRVLAEEGVGKPVLISRLAQEEEIPKKFLEVILLELRNKGILASKKGKGGGYSLLKAPEDITIGTVVRLFEGPLAPLPCVSETAFRRCDECDNERTCGTRSLFQEVRDAIAQTLDSTTLAGLMERDAQLRNTANHDIFYQI